MTALQRETAAAVVGHDPGLGLQDAAPKLSHRLWISETAQPSASAATKAIVSP